MGRPRFAEMDLRIDDAGKHMEPRAVDNLASARARKRTNFGDLAAFDANVARAGISQIRPGRAEVLVFVNQVTTSKDRPTPALATSSVLVTLVNADGRWLISDFKPI